MDEAAGQLRNGHLDTHPFRNELPFDLSTTGRNDSWKDARYARRDAETLFNHRSLFWKQAVSD